MTPDGGGQAARPVERTAARLGIAAADLQLHGRDIAKLPLALLERPRSRPGAAQLVLVTAITPTPAGEGKTTTCIGLADGLARLGESVCLALREPSLGPALGMKGGATGGGRARLVPADRIDLHFTGDFHAVASAHNLLAALIDNHLHHGNALDIDSDRIVWPRVLDLNDRALRAITIGQGGRGNGPERTSGFDITAASEVMAMLCLAENAEDLRTRIDRTLVAYRRNGEPVYARDLNATGAMLALLRDALLPNLVQTLEGTPALVHGGPFANIAHGCSSLIANRMALHHADWVITEAGFGSDLGAEKFFDIECAHAGLDPAAVVLVVTVRALKAHGGVEQGILTEPDVEAVRRGLPNLDKHVENLRLFDEPPLVALNRFDSDTEEEIAAVAEHCETLGVPFAIAEHHERGGAGTEVLATALTRAARTDRPFRPLYDDDATPETKILAVAQRMYGARRVVYTPEARVDLERVEALGLNTLPVCIAKVPGSLSDDPTLRGRPTDFDLHVRAIEINAGAGFLVVLTGSVLRMPGLPRTPLAEHIDLIEGDITGLG